MTDHDATKMMGVDLATKIEWNGLVYVNVLMSSQNIEDVVRCLGSMRWSRNYGVCCLWNHCVWSFGHDVVQSCANMELPVPKNCYFSSRQKNWIIYFCVAMIMADMAYTYNNGRKLFLVQVKWVPIACNPTIDICAYWGGCEP